MRKAGCEVPEYMLKLNTKRLKNIVKKKLEKKKPGKFVKVSKNDGKKVSSPSPKKIVKKTTKTPALKNKKKKVKKVVSE